MANQLAKDLEIMFENYVEGFEAACVVSRNAKKFRPGDTAMQRAGDVLYRPQHYHMNIEEGLDLSGKTPTALVQRLVPSVFKEPKNILYTLDAREMRDPEHKTEAGRAAGMRLAAQIDSDLISMVTQRATNVITMADSTTGSQGRDLWNCAAGIDATMTAIGVPQGINRRSFWNPFNYKDLAGELGHRAYAQGATLTAYEKAQIPPVASFDSYKTDISGRVPKGIGGVNSNAPSVNDIGNTLQLIRQNNDIERSGANNVGLTALQGLSGIAQAQRQKEFQQAYANAYASGDRGALRQLATQYPDQIESVRKGMGFIDEDQRNSIGTLAAGARLASSSPEAMQSWLQNNAKELTRVGVDPNNVAQMYQQNPSGFGEFVDHLGMAALGPIDYFNVQDKMADRQLTMRGQDLNSQTAARNQAITMRGQDIQANLGQQRINLDAETNRINNENKHLDRMLSAETNDLKRQEIQSRIAANNQKLQQKQQELNDGYKDGINTLTTSMFTLNDIVNSPALKSITGLRGAIPNVPGSQAADTQARLDTFKSQAYLTAVQAMKGLGALSDAEGKKLDQAVGSLQNSQSEETFRRNAGVIMNTLNQKRNEAVGKYVQQNGIKRVEAPQASIDYLKQHPELSIDFINRYGYLPSLGQ